MSARKKDRQFWESARKNNANYLQYYNRLTELAVAMFKWENLPETVDERYLELVLYTNGSVVFFKDEVCGFLALPCNVNGNYNVYGEPTSVMAYSGYNGYTKWVNTSQFDGEQDGIVIHNNMLHTNSMLDVEMYAMRLWELDRTIDINCKAQKTPVLIKCDQDQLLTLKNVYQKYEGNEPVIFGDKGLNNSGFTVLQTNAPYVADKLQTLKVQLYNEMLTYLGISNMNFMKKERLLHDEIMRSQGGVIASRYSRLNERQKAAEQINSLFGLNIECKYREDIATIYERFEDAEEGGFDGDIHDDGEDNP